jgi:twinkle protein
VAKTLTLDSIDFAEYERDTEAQAKVKAASVYAEEVVQHFALDDDKPVMPTVISKLKGKIEFRPGEVTAWAGYNGHRKSMYLGQVALDLTRQRQKILIASMEMQPHRTLARMSRQASAVRWPSPKWVRGFSDWTDDKLWLFDHMGRITPSQMIAVCRYFKDKLGGQHVVIDSLMMVCASEEHLDEQKQFVTDICRVAQETDLHVHVVAHCRKPQNGDEPPPSKYDIRGTAAISDQVGNVVTVWANKQKVKALEKDPHDSEWLAKPDAYVTVEKQRNGEWEGRAQFWFHPDSLRFCDDRVSEVMPMLNTGDFKRSEGMEYHTGEVETEPDPDSRGCAR